jgi:hypothetical protein
MGAQLAVIVLAALLEPKGANRPEMTRQEVPLTVPSEWVLKRVEFGGKRAEPIGGLKLDRQDAGRLEIGGLGAFDVLDCQIDPNGQHGQITFILHYRDPLANPLVRRSFPPSTYLGIYRIDRGRLLLCLSEESEGRPREFATKPPDGRFLLVFMLKK